MSQRKADRRSDCPINYGLEIFGDRWTLLVLRDLLLHGKRRFGEMLESEENIATNILSDRLQRLEEARVISRHRDDQDRRQVVYRPTEKGLALTRVLLEIAAWGAAHDANTGAPKGFASNYYANPESVLEKYRSED